ncbi:aminotransferase class V-fold PLP-dependent enzyme [Serpentinicella sp. ANB-PHB4]|nr:aminotransferase class V-fold PLP-dependent enzyme [Serpentinicella sp. ANB-PHB4]MDR5658899.1 aminotransferase class V-fold PLP-dependent enzyme [Serpentinicella sp. ANB-PHB4]
MIYLDNAATSFPKPKIIHQKLDEYLSNYAANPGRSGHRMALESSEAIFKVRELICQLFNIASPMQVIFTSSATESLNLAIKGTLYKGDHVITTSMEHNSVLRPIKALESFGITNTIIYCNENGMIDPKDVEESILPNTKLIAMTHASNVTGTLMPIVEIGEIAKKNNVYFLVDGAQTAGVLPIDIEKMNIDLLAVPAHKGLLGMQGLGILYIKEGLDVRHFKEGGTGSKSQELIQPLILPDRYETGTPNTPGIIALGASIEFILDKGIKKIREHEEELTKYFIDKIQTIDKIKVYGAHHLGKQASVVSINIKEEDSCDIGSCLDRMFNIAVRSGFHCAPLAHETIGTSEQGTVRFSFGYFNTKEEIDIVLKAIKEICNQV